MLKGDSRSAATQAAQGAALLGMATWLGLLVLAPWARSEDSPLAAWLYWFFDPVCHQQPERSFHLWGHPCAVCHRCSGIYVGVTLGFVAAWVAPSVRALLRARPRLAAWCLLPLAIDAVVVPLMVPNVPWSRVFTGLVAGAPLGVLVWLAVDQLARGRNHRPRIAAPETARGPT